MIRILEKETGFMCKEMKQAVIQHLRQIRTISVKNLSLLVNTSCEALLPVLNTLSQESYLRLVAGKSCGSSCSSCGSDCSDLTPRVFDENAIVVSHVKIKEEET